MNRTVSHYPTDAKGWLALSQTTHHEAMQAIADLPPQPKRRPAPLKKQASQPMPSRPNYGSVGRIDAFAKTTLIGQAFTNPDICPIRTTDHHVLYAGISVDTGLPLFIPNTRFRRQRLDTHITPRLLKLLSISFYKKWWIGTVNEYVQILDTGLRHTAQLKYLPVTAKIIARSSDTPDQLVLFDCKKRTVIETDLDIIAEKKQLHIPIRYTFAP